MRYVRINLFDGDPRFDAIEQEVAVAASVAWASPAQRRVLLVRRWQSLLGPTQLEHVTRHCEEVAQTSQAFAMAMGMDLDEVRQVRLAGLLHDIGKCVVPEAILAKAGPLDDDEWKVIAQHAEWGARISEQLGADEETVASVRHHHTWFSAEMDEHVPIAARLVCAADALVTMLSTRSYRIARTPQDVLAEMQRCSGTQFDPEVVDAAATALRLRRVAA